MLALFAVIGFLVGCFGTLIGAGGGFILMPIFFFLFPDAAAEHLTSLSLIVVFFNAFSGSVAYWRMGRIDFKSGILFSLTAIPGALLGALTTARLSRATFDLIFGGVMIAGGSYLWVKPLARARGAHAVGTAPVQTPKKLWIGCILSFGVGYLACLLGIGGGIIHVPMLAHLLEFPVHIATATSHFVLALTTSVGVAVHLLHGEYSSHGWDVVILCATVMLGAQVGAKLSGKVADRWIMRGLGSALVLVGVRLWLKSL